MKKRVLFLLLILCVLLSACETQDAAESNVIEATHSTATTSPSKTPILRDRIASSTEDRDLRQVLRYLENGEYRNAKETFENNILGSVLKENAIEDAFNSYIEMAIEDVNRGILSIESAQLFLEAGRRTELSGLVLYLNVFKTQLEHITFSMEHFTAGQALFEQKEYRRAYGELQFVAVEDINFEEALEMIYEMGSQLSESEIADDLLLSGNCLQFVDKNLHQYTDFVLRKGGEAKLIQLLHDVSLKSAEKLEELNRIQHAATEYGNAALYSYRLYSLVPSDELVQYYNRELSMCNRLVRQSNTLSDLYYYDEDYLLTENGVEALGENPYFSGGIFNRAPAQIVWDYYYPSDKNALGYIENCSPYFSVNIIAESYIDWAQLEEGNWLRSDGMPAVKIFLTTYNGTPDAIVLYSDGTVDIYSVNITPALSALDSWSEDQGDILDFMYADNLNNGSFVVLGKRGNVFCYPGLQFNTEDWVNITEISSGNANPEGNGSYTGSIWWSYVKSFLYGLDSSGTIYYVALETDSGKFPQKGTIQLEEPVVKIAGDAYLTKSGVLGSIEPEINRWLQRVYGQYTFSFIARENPGELRNDRTSYAIAATTTDGEVFIIDFNAVRKEIAGV